MILDSPDAEEFLEIEIPWCSAVLRPVGEISEAPGLSSTMHKGCDSGLLTQLQIFLRRSSEDNDSTSFNHLRDLLNAMESAKSRSTPLVGRTHKFSGWLAQPEDKWPDFTMKMMMEGDSNISERLILGKSGFHPGLSEIDDSVKPLGS